MAKRKYELTPEHRAQLPAWRDRWITNAMSTNAMTVAERDAMRTAIAGLYAAAKLPQPKHVVFVPSPFVLRFAGGFAAAIWWLSRNRPTRAATEAATGAATRAATMAATMDATRAATWAATMAATMDATRAATWAATEDATRDATMAATMAATWAATEDATRDATMAATMAATWDATEAATMAATWDATEDATRDATMAATMAATWDATEAATMAATWAATEAATWAATWAATEDATGAATRDATRDATRAATMAATWDEPLALWFTFPSKFMPHIARSLAGSDAALLLSCAGNSYSMWGGGNQWSAGVDFISFFRHVAKLPLDYSKWQHYEGAAIYGGPRIMHPDFCMVSDRPESLLVDAQNRPHCDEGPFCRWRDGSALYAVHGVRVPGWVIERVGDISVAKIDAEGNAEVRRVMVDRYPGGMEKYLADAGAKVIDRCDPDHYVHGIRGARLLRREVPDDEPIVAIECINSTPEPDGHRKIYTLRVPPDMTSAHAAMAWTWGLTAGEYRPMIET